MPEALTGRERVKRLFRHEEPDRIGFHEPGMYAAAFERWYGEGYPRDADFHEFFDFDIQRIQLYPTFHFEDVLIEDHEDRELRRGPNGEQYYVAKGPRRDASCVEYVDWLIKTRDDWENHKHRLAVTEDRFTPWWRETYARSRARNEYVFVSTRQPLWTAVNKVGYMRFMELLYDDPDWCRAMVRAHLQFNLDLIEKCAEIGCPVDGLYMTNGTTGKTGSQISPAMYWEFGGAYDRELVAFANERGLEVMIHLDGNWWGIVDEVRTFFMRNQVLVFAPEMIYTP